ncbi:alpha/beta hydrolase [Nocardioides sp.]|uniref:alpha/beta fold hydrolase n=1 Tax=Nocardioides sp. TaxID=35761 RepID=UPI001A21455A|nr:alpha/beta hydrolase [Nocardioides sp.]MBJ7358625.1 alpha/beta hydrolase [Nocardioides sp.]
MTEKQTFTVGEGDDLITYDVRGDLSSGTPLFMFASPMDASGFGSLASHFEDRPVVTYDPRGAGRNPTGTGEITPEQHAEDLHRVIAALGVGPVDAFGSSGGGVNLLALCAAHPEDVRTAVSHEPPIFEGLPDGEVLMAAILDITTTYASSGNGPAMAKFIQLVMAQSEIPADYLDQPAPDPAMFGQSAEDDGSRDNPLMRNMPACNLYRPDPEALDALGDRLVIAVGVESGDGPAARGGRAVAGRLGRPVADLPGDHGSFFDSSYGEPTGVAEVAARLRELIA